MTANVAALLAASGERRAASWSWQFKTGAVTDVCARGSYKAPFFLPRPQLKANACSAAIQVPLGAW